MEHDILVFDGVLESWKRAVPDHKLKRSEYPLSKRKRLDGWRPVARYVYLLSLLA